MSTVPAHCLDSSSSHDNTRAPSITKIEGCKVEEVGSVDLGILPGFQGGNKGESIAGGVGGSSSENIVKEEDVVRRDELLVCQPCDENVEVLAEGKTNSRNANTHDIGVIWHTCPQEGCEYKAKERGSIKKHLASIHDIGVIWHSCPQEGCDYKSKQRGTLKRHISRHHV